MVNECVQPSRAGEWQMKESSDDVKIKIELGKIYKIKRCGIQQKSNPVPNPTILRALGSSRINKFKV